MVRRARRFELRANLLGASFGLSGLAQCWSVADSIGVVPRWPADLLYVVAAAVWFVTAVALVVDVVASERTRTELSHPVFGPFAALLGVVPMLLGTALAAHARTAGETVFFTGLMLTLAIGGWLSGQWIVVPMRLAQWHPGYFLPTVAGGLVAAAGCATLGFPTLARLMFGYGMVCWIVLGSIILLRLFTEAPLPQALLPTMAIEVAPPVVAGGAWFAINGDRADTLALWLAGYALLMVLVQLRLIPIYRHVPFGPGWWSFSFSYAAAFAIGIRWLDVENVAGQRAFVWALLGLVTGCILALGLRTIMALQRGTYLTRKAPVDPVTRATSAERQVSRA